MSLNKKNCLTCIPNDDKNEDTIPLWYKKEGNYSLLPKILNCSDEYNANIKDLVEKTPEITDTEIRTTAKTGKPNTWVFYWAANTHKQSTVSDSPEKAYKGYNNKGLKKTDDSGSIEMVLSCPQPYKVNNVVYPRHIHYVLLNEDKTWDLQVRTKDVTCEVTRELVDKTLESRDHIIIDSSLTDVGTVKDRLLVDGSITIRYDELKEDTMKKKLILLLKPEKELRSQLNDIDILDIPIIVYSSSKNVEDSKLLIQKLSESGFTNISLYDNSESMDDTNNNDTNNNDTNNDTNNNDTDNDSINDDMFNLNINEETLILTENNNFKFIHEIYTDKLYIEKEDKKIYVGSWDGKVINWDDSNDAKSIRETYEKKEESSDIDGGSGIDDKNSLETESDSETDSGSDSESSSDSESDISSIGGNVDDIDDLDDIIKTESNKSNSINLQRLKKLLNSNIDGGGYKLHSINIKKDKPDLNNTIKNNFRGWGYTIF